MMQAAGRLGLSFFVSIIIVGFPNDRHEGLTFWRYACDGGRSQFTLAGWESGTDPLAKPLNGLLLRELPAVFL
jgi:hypothetical protein